VPSRAAAHAGRHRHETGMVGNGTVIVRGGQQENGCRIAAAEVRELRAARMLPQSAKGPAQRRSLS